MRIKYVGTSHSREISKRDWKNIGIEHDAVVIDTRKDAIVEVSDEAGQWLLDHERGDWKEEKDELRSTANNEDEDDGEMAPPTNMPEGTSGMSAAERARAARNR